MFNEVYNLLYSLIFIDIPVSLVGYTELVCTILSTCCCLFAVSIPFIIVIKVIKIILGR